MLFATNLATHLRLSHDFRQPTADGSIGTACHDVMSVLRPYHLHRVHRICMPASSQRGLGYWQLFGSSIPQQNLSCICASTDEIRVEGREGKGQYVRLVSRDDEVSSPLKVVILKQTHL